jgi:hypothetical protein
MGAIARSVRVLHPGTAALHRMAVVQDEPLSLWDEGGSSGGRRFGSYSGLAWRLSRKGGIFAPRSSFTAA